MGKRRPHHHPHTTRVSHRLTEAFSDHASRLVDLPTWNGFEFSETSGFDTASASEARAGVLGGAAGGDIAVEPESPLLSVSDVAALGAEMSRFRPGWMASRIRAERADAIADYHAEIARRALRARQLLAARGIHRGPVPYGYRTENTGRLEIDPGTASAVPLIFWLHMSEHLGASAIARQLATHLDDRYAPGGQHSGRHRGRHSRRSGAAVAAGWTRDRVARIVGNPALYAGRSRLLSVRQDPAGVGAVTAYHTHPALIAADDARRVLDRAGQPIPRGLTTTTPTDDRGTRGRRA
jgi:hypothetical protein